MIYILNPGYFQTWHTAFKKSGIKVTVIGVVELQECFKVVYMTVQLFETILNVLFGLNGTSNAREHGDTVWHKGKQFTKHITQTACGNVERMYAN